MMKKIRGPEELLEERVLGRIKGNLTFREVQISQLESEFTKRLSEVNTCFGNNRSVMWEVAERVAKKSRNKEPLDEKETRLSELLECKIRLDDLKKIYAVEKEVVALASSRESERKGD